MLIEISSKYICECLDEIVRKWNEKDTTHCCNWNSADVLEILIHREAKKQDVLPEITF